jgi:hypothetical protein
MNSSAYSPHIPHVTNGPHAPIRKFEVKSEKPANVLLEEFNEIKRNYADVYANSKSNHRNNPEDVK